MSHLVKTTITLVHGTWANDAAWVKEGSSLRNTLQEAVEHDVLFDPFYWPGENSLAGRYDAAQKLATRLKETIRSHSYARHIVVGHSHGGNIAAKALEIAGLFDNVDLVCLSTPFLHVNARAYTDLEKEVFFVSASLCAAILFMVVSRCLLPVSLQNGPLVYCGIALATVLAFFAWSRAKFSAEENAKCTKTTVPLSARLFIVNSAGDEALAGLGICQTVSWWLAKSACILAQKVAGVSQNQLSKSGFCSFLEKATVLGGCLIITCFMLLSLVESIFHPPTAIILWFCVALLCVAIPLILSIFVGGIVATVLPLVRLIANLLGLVLVAPLLLAIVACGRLFGTKAGVMNLLYRITADALPLGNRSAFLFVPQSSAKTSHSTTYEDPEALQALKKWATQVSE